MRHDDDDWAVFWCNHLGPILLEEVTAGERRRFLQTLSGSNSRSPRTQEVRLYSTAGQFLQVPVFMNWVRFTMLTRRCR